MDYIWKINLKKNIRPAPKGKKPLLGLKKNTIMIMPRSAGLKSGTTCAGKERRTQVTVGGNKYGKKTVGDGIARTYEEFLEINWEKD